MNNHVDDCTVEDAANSDSRDTPRPASLSRVQSARINGAKSRGPVTESGKSISSQNSLRHGLLARTIVLDGESPHRFAALLQRLRLQLSPQGAVEESFVNIMAACCWRRMRLWSLEKAAIGHEVAERESELHALSVPDAPTRVALAYRNLADNSRTLDLLSRYEARLDAQYDRALRRLEQMRAAREKRRIANEPRKSLNTFNLPE